MGHALRYGEAAGAGQHQQIAQLEIGLHALEDSADEDTDSADESPSE